MNIYISGQIFGQPIDQVAAIFEAAAYTIRCAGHTPINPLDFENKFTEDNPLCFFEIERPYTMIPTCDAMYVLHNAKYNPTLSRLEEASAVEKGLKIFHESNPEEFWTFIKDYNERGKEALANEEDEVW